MKLTTDLHLGIRFLIATFLTPILPYSGSLDKILNSDQNEIDIVG